MKAPHIHSECNIRPSTNSDASNFKMKDNRFNLEKSSSLKDLIRLDGSSSRSLKDLLSFGNSNNELHKPTDLKYGGNPDPDRPSFIRDILPFDDINEKIYEFYAKKKRDTSEDAMANLISFWSDQNKSDNDFQAQECTNGAKPPITRRNSETAREIKSKVTCAIRRMSSFRRRSEKIVSSRRDCIHSEKNGIEFANLMTGLGNMHVMAGNLELAKKSYESALHAIEHTDSKICQIQVARAFHGMGMIAFAEGYFSPSLTWLIEAKNTLSKFRQKGSCIDISNILEDMGFIYFVTENNKIEARECFKQSLDIRQHHNSKNKHDQTYSVDSANYSDPNIARLHYMIDIVVTGVKQSNIDFVKIIAQNPNAIGFMYPTIPSMVCHLGSMYKTKYEDDKSALECFISAKTMVEVAELQPCHPCVQYIQKHFQSCINDTKED